MGLAAVLAGPRHVDGQDGDTAMTVAQVLPVLVANDPESSREPSVFSTTVSRGSRREAILAVAVRLFRQHGYGGVGIEDVGAAAGITGPGVYRHFESKEEILAAAFNRASEQLAASVSRAFDIAATPQEALERLIASYAEITVENRDLFSVWMTEGHSLGPRGAAEFRRSQGAYLDDWMGVLGELRPALSEPEKRVMARGALGIVAGYTLGRVRLPLAQLRPTLVTITLAALDA
jgi:AcrR family transcriptional regulator